MVVVYVINSFDLGGAESGLLAMVKGGVFAGCRLNIVALVRGDGKLADALTAVGYQPRILENRARMQLFSMPSLLWKLRRLLRETRPDIVIASLPQANILARLSLLTQRHVTFISFEHNTHLAKRIYEFGYRATSGRVDWIFADAKTTLDTAVSRLYRSVPERRTIVPLLSLETRASAPVGDGDTLEIVNAARFTSVKNQCSLIEAVAILRGQGRSVHLTLYGDGPEQAACRGVVHARGLDAFVHFAGFVPNWSTLPADLFVLPSRHEGLCIVVLEAMHAGIPVVAPMIGGLKDYANGLLAFTLDGVTPEHLVRGIEYFVANREKALQQAELARSVVSQRFGTAVVQSEYRRLNACLLSAAEHSC